MHTVFSRPGVALAVLQTAKVVELFDEGCVINGATLSNLLSLIEGKYMIDIYVTKEKKYRALILLHSTIPGYPESGGKTWKFTYFLSRQEIVIGAGLPEQGWQV